MNMVIIGLGSNIDPEKIIEAARLLVRPKFQVLKESRFLTTKPMGNPNQADFINGAMLIRTDLAQPELKAILKGFEQQLGRTNTMGYNHPRTIDFDIHIWNGEIVDPLFYKWEFIRTIVLELLPELKYDLNKVNSL